MSCLEAIAPVPLLFPLFAFLAAASEELESKRTMVVTMVLLGSSSSTRGHWNFEGRIRLEK